jgi:hypothetical protein
VFKYDYIVSENKLKSPEMTTSITATVTREVSKERSIDTSKKVEIKSTRNLTSTNFKLPLPSREKY